CHVARIDWLVRLGGAQRRGTQASDGKRRANNARGRLSRKRRKHQSIGMTRRSRAPKLARPFMLATLARLAAAQNGEPSSAPAVVVRMIEDCFVPATVRIRPGEAVRWDNVSLDTHTVNIDPVAARFPDHSSLPRHSEPVDSGPLGLGASFTHRF